MNDDRNFERTAQAWLELGPSVAPERVLNAALTTVETTSQQRNLRIPWRFPRMTTQARFLSVAAVGLIVIAAGAYMFRNPQSQVAGPGPSPSPMTTVAPNPTADPTAQALEEIQGTWASVGTRSDPIGNHSNPPLFEVMTVDPGALRINSFGGDITSSASFADSDGPLSLQMQSPQELLGDWDCRTGDLGQYGASMSADRQTLTLTSATDSCLTRAAILTGDWTRWVCPPEFQYAYCDHAIELTPGRYVSPIFRPFSVGTSGQLAYSVPAGWADLQKPPTWPSADSPARLGLATLAAPDALSIIVYSTLHASLGRAVISAPTLDCPNFVTASHRTASSVADWLESLPYLAVTQRTPITIGGLSGVQIDLSLAAGFVDPCAYGTAAGGSIEYSRQIEIFRTSEGGDAIYMDAGADDYARFIVLDTGVCADSLARCTLVIALSASGQSALDAVIAQAMPVIESFEFIP